MYKRIAFGGLAALGLALGSVATVHADEGIYVGFGIGKASLELDDDLGLPFDASDTAFKLYGGYMFNDYFGLEAAYFDAGDLTEDYGGVSLTEELSGLNISFIGSLPIGQNFAVFGKFGVAAIKQKLSARGSINDSVEDDGDEISYGFGAALRFGVPFEIRAEYEAFDVDDANFSIWTVSGLYRF